MYDYDYDEMMNDWQATSMEDAIWDRGRKDYWWKVPKRPENENKAKDDFEIIEIPY